MTGEQFPTYPILQIQSPPATNSPLPFYVLTTTPTALFYKLNPPIPPAGRTRTVLLPSAKNTDLATSRSRRAQVAETWG